MAFRLTTIRGEFPLDQCGNHIHLNPMHTVLCPDLVEQVRPVVRGPEHQAVLQREHLFHVLQDLGSGGGCEAENGNGGELALQNPQDLVVGPEVVSPLTRAVNLCMHMRMHVYVVCALDNHFLVSLILCSRAENNSRTFIKMIFC